VPSLWSNTRPDCLSGALGNKGRKEQQSVGDEIATTIEELEAKRAQAKLGGKRVAQREAGQTGDFKQGVVAFLQRRPPSFDGR
jgi:hypothetical protein